MKNTAWSVGSGCVFVCDRFEQELALGDFDMGVCCKERLS